MAISYGTYTITEVQEGSQIWTTTTAPSSPNYTFTVSKLVGDSDTSIKVGDIVMYSYYRYTVLSVSSDGTTVLTGNRTSIRGATGAASVTYSLIVSNLAIIKDKNGDISPVAITLTAKSQTGSNAMANYAGRFKIETTTDNSTWTAQYTSSANEATKTWNVIDDIIAIRCSLYLKDGTTTLLDQQTIPIVSDGIDGTNITITSTSVTYQEGESGTVKPTGTWGTGVPTVAQGHFLWTKTIVNYSDGSYTESYSVARQGNNGTNGTSPTVSSTVVEYQQSTNGKTVPTGTWGSTPPTAIAEQFMWTRITITYSDNATAISYSVSRNGTNGTSISISSTSVTYQKGTSGTVKPTGNWETDVQPVGEGEYLWTKTVVTYSDSSKTESYSVSRNAVNGTNGTSPTVTSTVTEYVQSNNGTTTPTSGWDTTPPSTVTAGYFMWTRVTVTYSDNATSVSYTVSKNGTNGNNGINTATVYLYKRGTTAPSVPSGNTTYTFSTKKLTGTLDSWSQAIPTSGDGQCYVIAAVASSSGTTDTIGTGEWSTPIQFNGTNGINGTDGTNGLNQATIFLYKRGTSVTKPTTSVTYTFSTGALSAEPNSWKRNIPTIDGNPCWVVTATAIGNGATTTITGSNWSDPVKLVEDGEDGKDAYTIVLTNENHTFAGNTTSAIASEIECNIIAYKGTTQVASTIGTITGQPTGMTTTILNNGTVNTAFRVSVTTSMVTKNGVLNVPVTVDGKAFTKKFTYALTLDGEKGDKGDTAQWYYGESLTHTSGTATLPISQTDDVTVGAMYLNTKTGSCYKCTAISGSNATWTYAGNITDSIDIDRRNLIWNTASPNIISWNNSKQLYGWAVQSGGNGTGSIETISDSPIGGLNKTFRISNNTSGNKDFAQVVMPELNTNFDIPHTFSAYVRGVGDNATALIRSWNNTKSKVAFSQSIAVTTEWQKVEVVFQSFTNSVAGDSLDVRFGLTGIGSIEYIAPKFELGEKATGWTPAPEDIEAEVSNLRTDLQSQIDEKIQTYYQATAPSWSSTTDRAKHNGDLWYCTESDPYTGYEAKNVYRYDSTSDTWVEYSATSELFDEVDGKSTIFYGTTSDTFDDVDTGDYLVDSTDGSSYRWNGTQWVKVTDYQTAIDNIEIGGRNLLKGSDVTSLTTFLLGGTSTQVIPSGTVITLSVQIDADDVVWASSGNRRIGVSSSIVKDGGGNQYIEAWAAMTGRTGTGIDKTFDTSFHGRVKSTYTLQGELPLDKAFNLHTQSVTSGTVSVSRPKLELGNKATDWTPAPEDINAEISTKADSTDAVFEEQLIYISKASGTLSVDGTTTWITENGDVQNTWSTKRPTYNTDYPVLFIAKQRKTVSGTVTCTTPTKDDTTTVIDGGHITTGTIDASVVSVTNIDASNISTGILNADIIGANSIDASKIDVSSISIGNLNGASNYAQKTDVTNAINKEIGGRNLIIGTLYPDARGGGIYRPHIFGQITNTAGRGTCIVAEHGIRFTNTTANWQYIYFGSSSNSATPCMLGLEAGETYTLSADLSWKILSSDTGKANTTTYYMGAALAYSNTESGSFSGLPHSKQFAITQADKGTDMSGKLIYTFTVPETAKKLYLGIVSDNKTASHYAIGDYIEAKNLKLEKGSKATQWTPAPEDLVEQTGWSVLINVSSIDFINNTATLHASVYKDGNIQSSGFTLQWYKTTTSTSVTPEETTTTIISSATSSILSVTDLDASYTCVVN